MQPLSAMTRGVRPLSMLREVLLLGVLALQIPAVFADSANKGVHHLLSKMVQAVHELNYDGTFVLLHDNHLETMRVVHTLSEGGERERLISLNGAAREVVRDNASVTCISPDARSVSVAQRMLGRGFRAVFSIDTTQLTDFYDFKIIGQDRVAGRGAKVVVIIPRDGYRYGYRIYLDEESMLPLKTDMLDETGSAVSQVMFISLRIADDIKDEAETTLEGKELYKWVQRDIRNLRHSAEDNQWEFDWLPDGFQMSIHTQTAAGAGTPKMDHYVLSDGLATLSVYVESAVGERGLRGSSQMGAVNAFGRASGKFQITAVGEVPAVTVQKIANALRYINP